MTSDNPHRVALLRAVNVGGRKVLMAELKEAAAAVGLTDAKTLLQSGNLVFVDPEERSSEALERLLEDEAARRFGFKIEFVVRTPEQWSALIAGNPFPQEAIDDPGHLVVAFVKDRGPSAEELAALRGAIVGRERADAAGRDIYLVYPDGIGKSKLNNTVIERALGKRRVTARNWNTVLKLATLIGL